GWCREPTATFEHGASRAEIHAHADVEIRFSLPAHHGGQVKDRIGVRVHRTLDECGIRKIAADNAYARVAELSRRCDVDQHELTDRARDAACVRQSAALENRAGKPRSKK